MKASITWRPSVTDLRRLVSFALAGLVWMAVFPSIGLASRAWRGGWFAAAFLPVILVLVGTRRSSVVEAVGWILHLLTFIFLGGTT